VKKVKLHFKKYGKGGENGWFELLVGGRENKAPRREKGTTNIARGARWPKRKISEQRRGGGEELEGLGDSFGL